MFGSSPSERQQGLQNPTTVSPLGFRPPSQLSYTGDSLNEQGYDPSGGQEVVSKLAELSSFRGGLISHPVDLASTRQDASPQASREGVSSAVYDVVIGCEKKRHDNPGRAEGSKAGGWVDGVGIRSHVLLISSPQQASLPTNSEAMPAGPGDDRVNARRSSYDGRVDLGMAIPVSPRQGIVSKALANPGVCSFATNQGVKEKGNGWPPIHVEPSESTSGEAVSYNEKGNGWPPIHVEPSESTSGEATSYNEKGNGWPPIRVEPSESTSGEAVSYNSVLSCAVGHSEDNGPSEPVLNGDGDTIGTVEPSCALEGSDGLAFLAGSRQQGCLSHKPVGFSPELLQTKCGKAGRASDCVPLEVGPVNQCMQAPGTSVTRSGPPGSCFPPISTKVQGRLPTNLLRPHLPLPA